jgi:hypothetical protein
MAHRWGLRKTNIIYIFVAVACLFVPLPVRPTTILAIWTPDRIILAADTALSSIDGTKRIGNVCKLKRESAIWFATAGLFEFSPTGFDMPSIIRKRYERRPTVNLDVLGVLVDSDIDIALDDARKSVDATLRANQNLNISELIIIGPNHGVEGALYSTSNIYGSTARDNGGGGKEMHATFGSLLLPTGRPYRAELAVAGEKDAIVEYLMETPAWQGSDPVALARLFIELEMTRHPITVGPPIAIVSIAMDGTYHWEGNEPEACKQDD